VVAREELHQFYKLHRSDVFDQLQNREWFIKSIATYYQAEYERLRMSIRVSERRLRDAYGLWMDDMARVKFMELRGRSEPDHFKRAAHLAYWLRRCSPVIEVNEELTHDFKNVDKLREFYFRYGNEFIAFDIGYQLCLYFEVNKDGAEYSLTDYKLTSEYIHIISHFFKTKSVSPHALFLIYTSLFLNTLDSRNWDVGN
jgi:hypothetical protein